MTSNTRSKSSDDYLEASQHGFTLARAIEKKATKPSDTITQEGRETPDTDKGCSIGLPRRFSTLPAAPERLGRL